ncbi:hypothetical protein CDD83_5928 [Cordyceps sp. RAO-2017]|nr:hypothetical protein CDD83_5928 [Cordyceps sp. RAO-2017]
MALSVSTAQSRAAINRPQAAAVDAPRTGASNGELCSSSTLLDPASSSTLRARLRSQDPVLEASLNSPEADGAGADVYQRFRACFSLDPSSSAASQVKGKGKRLGDKGTPLSQLRDTFAEEGLRFYASVTQGIMQARNAVNSRISDLGGESAAVLSRAEALYSNIAYPLSATLCHAENVASATIATHLSALDAKLSAAQEELDALQSEWEACLHDEQQAWAELRKMEAEMELAARASGGGVVARELARFRDEAESILQAHEEMLDDVDAEFKESMRGETMRMMQRMMAN